MINDYAEVLATLQIKTVKLNDACAQRKYLEVMALATKLCTEMVDLSIWAMEKQKENENE